MKGELKNSKLIYDGREREFLRLVVYTTGGETYNFFSHTEDKIFVKDNNYFESFTRVKRLSFASKKEGVCLRFVADGFTFVSDPIAFFDVQFRDGGKLKVQSKDMSDILDYYLLCNAQKRA